MWYVYILLCSDKRTYIGCTNDLKDRIVRHQKGQIAATKDRLPVRLIAYFAVRNKDNAFAFEKYLKTGSGRVFLKKRLLGEIAYLPAVWRGGLPAFGGIKVQ